MPNQGVPGKSDTRLILPLVFQFLEPIFRYSLHNSPPSFGLRTAPYHLKIIAAS